MGSCLTTHVLDTVQGRPAVNMRIQLWRLSELDKDNEFEVAGKAPVLLKTVWTNADGRVTEPLLEGELMVAGRYELVFGVGEYFIAQGISTTTPPFLDLVPIIFGIAEPLAHYHIPLLISPWAYSTYRGS
jgi:5-hydroxyisourate hydrolase